MARGKRGAPRGRGGGRGNPRGGGRGGRGGRGGGRSNYNHDREDVGNGTDFIPFAGAPSMRPQHHGNSMRFEALNTQMHESHWASGQQLRHNRVAFVSAGGVEESAAKTYEEAMAGMSLKEARNEILADADDEAAQSSRLIDSAYILEPENYRSDQEASKASPKELLKEHTVKPISPEVQWDNTAEEEIVEESAEDTFIIDTTGAQPFTTGLPPPRIRSPSPTPSNSSEEVILFGGRDSTGKAIRRASPIRTPRSFQRTITDDVPKTKSTLARVPSKGKHSPSAHAASSAQYEKPKDAVQNEDEGLPLITPKEVRNSTTDNAQHSKASARSKKQILEDELMADYIENLKEQGLDPSAPYNQRELGGTDSEGWAPESEDNILEERNDVWTKSDLSDFDNLSTSDGNVGIVEEILSKRERMSGVQYLIVWEGTSMDEARWVPELALVDQQAKEMIDKFLVEEQLIAEAFCTDSESDSDEDDEFRNGPGDDSQDDDEDLKMEREIERKIERMSDEQVARLLAKQEELGMGSESLMLFDGLDGDEGDEEGEGDGFMPASASRRRPRIDRTPRKAKGEFPSATLTADAYDGFDVMDFERPSLSIKKKTKGRKGKPVFDLSDSELERSMNDAWDLDRHKKSAKKREREELRAAGLLDSGRAGKPDMKAKYKEGMNIEEIKEEMRDFLMGTNTTLSLPPMDKTYRKVVHEIANAFNLKSKSAGNGTTRFPVVYRTQRSVLYTETAFRRVEGKVARYLPRPDVKGKRPAGRATRGGFGGGGGGGGGGGAGGYRDGDIVGGSAKELGIENRGRAMLEKMGWSSGTALGALNNKGILEPVSHVVKTTKAGLG